MTTIVVGVEDSFRAQDAVVLAGDLARAVDADVLAVAAFAPDDSPRVEAARRAAVERMLDQLCEPLSDLEVRRLAVAHPCAADALLDADGDLVVVGSTHGAFTGRVAPGSTGRRLLERAHVPVALAPQGHRMRVAHEFNRITATPAAVATARALADATGQSLRVWDLPGDPARELARESEVCDLLVLGADDLAAGLHAPALVLPANCGKVPTGSAA